MYLNGVAQTQRLQACLDVDIPKQSYIPCDTWPFSSHSKENASGEGFELFGVEEKDGFSDLVERV
ncbi:MAG TPA: hypothetical protein DCE42_07380 [Myxococcales bacterium]|nr:hypothetical protein [Myxococcales bacterium]|tara:strand:- start:22525 stop:22719 length:195 start_codon:yes stop_codon:yes gene_type:complete